MAITHSFSSNRRPVILHSRVGGLVVKDEAVGLGGGD